MKLIIIFIIGSLMITAALQLLGGVKGAWLQIQSFGSKLINDSRIGDIGESFFTGDPFDMASATSQFIGDFEDGDFDEDGDPAFETASETGDLEGEEIGALRRKRKTKKVGRIKKALAKRGAKRAGRAAAAVQADRAAHGLLNAGDTVQFVSAKGVIIQSIDLFANNASYPAFLLKGALDRGQLESPGISIVQPTSTPNVEWGTSVGASQYFLYAPIVLKLGVSTLNGVANQVITITAKLPVLNGPRQTVVITAQLQKGFDGTITLYPFQIVQGKPVFVYGRIGGDVPSVTGDEALFTITGLPSGAVASILVPLSEHAMYQELQRKVS